MSQMMLRLKMLLSHRLSHTFNLTVIQSKSNDLQVPSTHSAPVRLTLSDVHSC